jgi:hypothetical protein
MKAGCSLIVLFLNAIRSGLAARRQAEPVSSLTFSKN